MNSDAEHAMLEAASALLQQGQIIDRLSRLLTVAALVLLIGASAFDVASPALAVALALAVLAGRCRGLSMQFASASMPRCLTGCANWRR